MTMSEADDLIQTVLDGEASPAEKSRLEELAAASPQVRQEMEAVQRLFAELKAAGETDVPPGLAESVLRELRRRPAAVEGPVRAFEPARARRRNLFVAGWAAAAMLAIVVAWPLVRPSIEDQSVSSGAMVDHERQWTEIGRAATPSGSMSVTLRRNGDLVSVETSLGNDGSVRIVWSGGLAPRERIEDGTIRIDCPQRRCGPVTFVHTAGQMAAIQLESSHGDILDIEIP